MLVLYIMRCSGHVDRIVLSSGRTAEETAALLKELLDLRSPSLWFVPIPRNWKNLRHYAGFINSCYGGPGGSRTSDTRFRKPLLYPLSYGAAATYIITYSSGNEKKQGLPKESAPAT